MRRIMPVLKFHRWRLLFFCILPFSNIPDEAIVREQEQKTDIFKLDRQYNIEIEIEVDPNWYN